VHSPSLPRPREPPARMMAITEGRVSLRASAWIELHAWLAAAAKTDGDVGPELGPAKSAYKRSLEGDDEDTLLRATAAALSSCSDDTCAAAAVSPQGFGHAYARALPVFIERWWLPHATTAYVGIEAAHAALGPEAEAIFVRAAADLGVTWPDQPVTIDVVSEAPPVSRAALIPFALATRGRCFLRDPRAAKAESRVEDAKVIDCALVHALLGGPLASPLRSALVRELGAHDGERAWALVVIHAVAATVAGWEPKHASVYRRSASAVEASVLQWLSREWRGASTVSADLFAQRLASHWRTSRSLTRSTP
jgi:hypothetical protein